MLKELTLRAVLDMLFTSSFGASVSEVNETSHLRHSLTQRYAEHAGIVFKSLFLRLNIHRH